MAALFPAWNLCSFRPCELRLRLNAQARFSRIFQILKRPTDLSEEWEKTDYGPMVGRKMLVADASC